jgi:hypothetical protein
MGYEAWSSALIALVLFVVTLPILSRQARREKDRRLFGFLMFALFLKLIVGTLLRYYVTFHVYARADAAGYLSHGTEIARQMSAGTYHLSLGSLSGSDSISFLTGVLLRIIGPTGLGAFFIFSWLAFIGLFLLYRAFVIAVPKGNARTYARFIFFLPTIWYWPSSIGKESWLVFTLGIAAIGAARALSGNMLRGLGFSGLGLWLMLFVRPHIAGIFGVALLAAFLVMRPAREARPYAYLGKAVGLVIVGALAIAMIMSTARFLHVSNLTPSGAVGELRDVSTRSAYGGSEFTPVIVTSPLGVPKAVLTVLFRPFVTEVDNAQALAAALESTFLLVLTVKRLPWVWSAIKSVRRQPFVGLALVFTAVFVIAFASFPNFGLLARERVQVLPFFLILLSIPTDRSEEAEPDVGKVRERTPVLSANGR